MRKAQLVFVPFPGIGHLISTVEMAKLLVGRDDRLSITVLIMKFPFENNTQSLSNHASDRIRIVELSHDTPSAADPNSKPGSFFPDLIEIHKPRIRDVVSNIVSKSESASESESESTPRLAGLVIDMFGTSIIDMANEFGIPTYVFFTSNAGLLGFFFHFQTLHDHHNQDVTKFKDSDAELTVPAFAYPVPVKVLPCVFLGKWSTTILNIARRCRETKGIMVNTFTELDFHALKSLEVDKTIQKIYPVGPVLNLKGGGGGPNEAQSSQSEADIMRWLDDQDPASVVFLCFGSMGTFDEDQVKEIARALESCGHPFLWSLRQPPAKGKVGILSEYENLTDILPEGFLETTAGIGKVIGWAPQVAVLSHPAVGGFVSHCGWNSTLESLWYGVPVATWPMYAEQQLNAFQMVKGLGMTVEIKMDYRNEFGMETFLVTVEEISSGIRQLMDSSNEIREKVKQMSEKSRAAMMEGGSSYNSLGCFIEDVMKDFSLTRIK
ncbi:UDP-glycosyltransferase 71A16-like isoform X2 [Camellia sinensis]|uniref:UDP-glycosyltransferase 71A16-like isoform X2 n=1 Tax=Camellia sinensis TaxID=4442 RepID=UPI001035D90D|nr:UDP-glycosyltransferase 71A16-like isoform X2 [Camellia sinensis]